MRIITGKTIREYQAKYPRAAQPLQAWFYEAKHAQWRTPDDVKQKYGNASILPDNRVVFNIGGNKYRLGIRVMYKIGWIYVRFFGTHAEYDKINAEEI